MFEWSACIEEDLIAAQHWDRTLITEHDVLHKDINRPLASGPGTPKATPILWAPGMCLEFRDVKQMHEDADYLL